MKTYLVHFMMECLIEIEADSGEDAILEVRNEYDKDNICFDIISCEEA